MATDEIKHTIALRRLSARRQTKMTARAQPTVSAYEFFNEKVKQLGIELPGIASATSATTGPGAMTAGGISSFPTPVASAPRRLGRYRRHQRPSGCRRVLGSARGDRKSPLLQRFGAGVARFPSPVATKRNALHLPVRHGNQTPPLRRGGGMGVHESRHARTQSAGRPGGERSAAVDSKCRPRPSTPRSSPSKSCRITCISS